MIRFNSNIEALTYVYDKAIEKKTADQIQNIALGYLRVRSALKSLEKIANLYKDCYLKKDGTSYIIELKKVQLPVIQEILKDLGGAKTDV